MVPRPTVSRTQPKTVAAGLNRSFRIRFSHGSRRTSSNGTSSARIRATSAADRRARSRMSIPNKSRIRERWQGSAGERSGTTGRRHPSPARRREPGGCDHGRMNDSAPAREERDRLLAEAVALRAGGAREEARERLVALAARLPGDAEVAYQTAWAHDVLGREAEAVPHYEAALAGSGLTADDRRGALLGLGSTYRTLGRYEEAVALLEGAVDAFPEDGALRAFLAMALYNTGRHHDSVRLLLTLVAETSGDPSVRAYRPAIEHYARDLDAIG